MDVLLNRDAEACDITRSLRRRSQGKQDDEPMQEHSHPD